MDVTPHELRDCQITDAFRGYNRDEVNELMERAAATIETQAEKIRILTERVSSVTTDSTRTRDNEDIIQRTLILAQRAADEAVAEAGQRSAEMLADAEARSRALVDEANAEVRRVHDVERVRLDGEIRELASRRDALHADVGALELWEREYRARVVGQLEADLATAKAKRAAIPAAPPAPVAAPEAAFDAPPTQQIATVPTSPPETGGGALPVADTDSGAGTPNHVDLDITTPPAAEPSAEHSLDVESVVEAVAVPVGAAPSRPAPPSPLAAAPTASPTGQSSGASVGAQRSDAALPVDAEAVDAIVAARLAAPLAGSASRIAQAAPEARSAEIDVRSPHDETALDDDAFFATLRDAVRDDSPLGPSDDRLFDAERDAGLRDIFKRRR